MEFSKGDEAGRMGINLFLFFDSVSGGGNGLRILASVHARKSNVGSSISSVNGVGSDFIE